MLDVAACAERLIAGHTAFRKFNDEQIQALIILVALHDIGKLSESFRALIRENKTGAPRHWQLSDFLLVGDLDEALNALGADSYVRAELCAAVAGHHGSVPDRASGDRQKRHKRQRAIGSGSKAAIDWTTQLIELFPGASLEGVTHDQAKVLSWLLSGLTVAADWVGSNTEWFPIKRIHSSIGDALVDSRKRAGTALLEAGLNSPVPVKFDAKSFPGIAKLRPMQKAASIVALEEGPQLAVIEDATGSGKTEAAIILAHRMITTGKARGIFFALPTMATSNAMFERMLDFASELFLSPPSFVLTHGRAKLQTSVRGLHGSADDSTPEASCSAWLSDNRRRALLATVGVGTVDQALLGVLPTRFSTLRLFGLSDRVLIVDEAHSYDPYMKEELGTLLRMHAMFGGSAILMTATLPLEMRESYVSAFRSGLTNQPGEISARHYPGLHVVAHDIASYSVDPLPASVRTVCVSRVPTSQAATELLKAAAADGAACVYIRNAVDDAIETADEFRRQGLKVDLLHARFAMVDRIRHEQKLVQTFGKHGSGREGRILIATQVVEASLDLDFDVMVSDLAPIGSLIQRAGRLWRHMDIRPACSRPCHLNLNVVSPDPYEVKDDKWLRDALPRGAWVYRLDEQWLTSKAIFDTGDIAAPKGLRKLIEAVHGKDAPTVPEVLQKAQDGADGEAIAQAGLARANLVEGDSGFLAGTRGAIGGDATFPTRLGEPQVTMVLARNRGGRLIPWADEEDPQSAWALSEVSAARKRFLNLLPDQDAPEIREVKSTWPEWRRKSCEVCPVDAKSGRIGEGLLYSTEKGLSLCSL